MASLYANKSIKNRLSTTILVIIFTCLYCIVPSVIPLVSGLITCSTTSTRAYTHAIVPTYLRASGIDTENDGKENNDATTTSLQYALNPDSDEAHDLIVNQLGIDSSDKYTKLKALAQLVVSWNERLNLISRKDCTVEVVFGRHILPSIALSGVEGWDKEGNVCSLFHEQMELELGDDEENISSSASANNKIRVVDIGTGGGFPGLPLAIMYPEIDFTLVDSVGKKLKAIDEMADELSLENVSTYHGRAEEMIDLNPQQFRNTFDVCVGRSVAALPRFCFWINGLLRDNGKLLYIIGGELDDVVQDKAKGDIEISRILGDTEQKYSDKRVLLFGEADVKDIAIASGEKKEKRGAPGTSRHRKKSNIQRNSNKLAKGAWARRDSNEPKQRGAEDFKRYTVN